MTGVRVDAHQHFWNLGLVEYPWLTSEYPALLRTFEPLDLEPSLRSAGIDYTVLVQAANSSADTDYMLQQADMHSWIGAVVGWVPLLEPREADRALDRLLQRSAFRGVRHLIHEEPDPNWIVQVRAIEGLRVLAEHAVPFDFVAVFPHHLEHIPALVERIPGLTIIIDHLAKPPIKTGEIEAWAGQLATVAQYPNVYAKISGLNTAARPGDWTAGDIKPYVEVAIDCFGVDRLMYGSDWPYATLHGDDYPRVWTATNEVLEGHSSEEIDALLGGTASRVYNIERR
ncbi:MAG: amidohydrolase family protein [Chloroflexota bacterium]